jgi:hypothetical protein
MVGGVGQGEYQRGLNYTHHTITLEQTMHNIFWMPATIAEEDHFTASLHFLIDNAPDIGQAIVDHITDAAGIARTRLLHAIDQPACSNSSRPDFLFECEDFNIICEHKVASRLRKGQLESYLTIRRRKRCYVVFISRDRCPVPAPVLRHDRYLRPRSLPANHFRWSGIYPIVSQRNERLARDFAEYMQLLGMAPVSIGPLGVDAGRLMRTADDICALADESGIGQPFRAIRSAAECNGLYARPYKYSIMYTAPWNRSRMLFTICATNTTDNHIAIYVSPSTFAEFYPTISRQAANRALGNEGWHEMDEAAIETFIEGLDMLLGKCQVNPSR